MKENEESHGWKTFLILTTICVVVSGLIYLDYTNNHRIITPEAPALHITEDGKILPDIGPYYFFSNEQMEASIQEFIENNPHQEVSIMLTYSETGSEEILGYLVKFTKKPDDLAVTNS